MFCQTKFKAKLYFKTLFLIHCRIVRRSISNSLDVLLTELICSALYKNYFKNGLKMYINSSQVNVN